MWITEYNEERAHAQFLQEGIEIGEARGLVRGIAKLVKDGVITLAQGAEQLEMTKTEFIQKAAALGFELC